MTIALNIAYYYFTSILCSIIKINLREPSWSIGPYTVFTVITNGIFHNQFLLERNMKDRSLVVYVNSMTKVINVLS